MKFSANFVSVLRFLLSCCSIFFISLAREGNIFWPSWGILLMAFQVTMDFADGPIARIHGKCNNLGEKLDGLSNTSSRAAIIILFGFFTSNNLLLWISVFSGIVLSLFWDITAKNIFKNGRLNKTYMLFRLSSSVVLVVLILPIMILIINILSFPLREFSCLITILYAALAILWLIICSSR